MGLPRPQVIIGINELLFKINFFRFKRNKVINIGKLQGCIFNT